MAQIPNLQSTNTLGVDDQAILRQGTIDKRIGLNLAGILSWARRNGYDPLGEHTTGVQFPDTVSFTTFQGKVYFVKDGVTLPYTATGNDPSVDTNLYVKSEDSLKDEIYSTVSNTNLLSNHNFLIPSALTVDATPQDASAGTEIFSNVFAGSSGIQGLTYIDGRVSFSGGDFYMPVPNTGAIARLTPAQLTASVADFDGKPRTRGVSFALVGDEYRVTVGVDALEDGSGNATPLGSVKFEQGSVATGHEVQSPKGQTYTFNTVSEMKLQGAPAGSKVQWLGYYSASDGGSNWGVVKKGAHTDDGFSVFSIDANTYIEANLNGDKLSAKKAGLSESGTPSENSSAIQTVIDFIHNKHNLGTVGGGGGVCYIPEGLYDHEGYITKLGVNFIGDGRAVSVLQLVGDNKTAMSTGGINSGANLEFKGIGLVPKDPATLNPTGQIMWDAIGYTKVHFEDVQIGWCGGVTGVSMVGAPLSGVSMWYNKFDHVFVERAASWPSGGTGWLLGSPDITEQQVTTWLLNGGRTSGAASGEGFNIQGASTVAFNLHVVESCDFTIGSVSGTRGVRGVTISPIYLEGSGTLTIHPNAEFTTILGGRITGFTVVDNSNTTQWIGDGIFKSYAGNAGTQEWKVHIEGSRLPELNGNSLLPGFRYTNVNDLNIAIVNGRGSGGGDSHQIFRVLYDDESTVAFQGGVSSFAPGSDGVVDLGRTTFLWNNVRAANGSIVTSDERLKTEIISLDKSENECALEIKRSIGKFKKLDSVERKGFDGARWHFGVGAQTVKSIFEKHGLDGFDYGVLCYDEWDDEVEVTPAVYEDGKLVSDEKSTVTKSAGNRYGVRYDELAMFILASS